MACPCRSLPRPPMVHEFVPGCLIPIPMPEARPRLRWGRAMQRCPETGLCWELSGEDERGEITAAPGYRAFLERRLQSGG